MKNELATSVFVYAAFALESHAGIAFGAATDSSVDAITGYSLVVPFVVILAAAAGATLLLRRWRGSFSRRDGPLQLVHVIALGPRERLALVKVANRYLVVGITPAQISRVAELDDLLDGSADQLARPAAAVAPSASPSTAIPPE